MSMEPLPVRVRRTLKLGPVETLHVARRQADALVARRIHGARARIALRLARLGTDPGDAVATYFAVLDGHTLNLQVMVPSLDGVDTATAEVVFHRGRSERRAAAALRRDYDGTWYAEATAVLGTLPGRLPLTRGVWQVRIEVTRAPGEPHRLAVRRLVPEAPRRGPTIADPWCPDTGTRFQAVTSPLGACRIVVKPARPGAEVSRLLVEPGRAEIVGRFVGVGDAAGAVAEFRRAGDGTVRVVPVEVRGDVFLIAAPLRDMVPEPDAEDFWQIRVRLAGGRRLPVGRFVHDLRSVRKTLRGYERQMLVPGVAMFHLRPQYSNAGRLTLTCTSVDTGEQA